jgi:hypothetical protein
MSGSDGRRALGARGEEQTRTYWRTWVCASVVLLVAACASQANARQAPGVIWTGTWATAPMHDNSGRVFHGRRSCIQALEVSVVVSGYQISLEARQCGLRMFILPCGAQEPRS